MKSHLLASALLAATLVLGATPAHASAGPQPVANQFTIPAPRDIAYPGTIRLHVDATDLAHRIFRVHETIPVSAGPVTLLYPQWIPGHHSPTGPIDKFAGLVVKADGKTRRVDPRSGQRLCLPHRRTAGRACAGRELPVPVAAESSPGSHRDDPGDAQPAVERGRAVSGRLLRPRHPRCRPASRCPRDFKFATALRVAHHERQQVHLQADRLREPGRLADLRRQVLQALRPQPGRQGAGAPERVRRRAAATWTRARPQIQAHRNLVTQMHRLYGSFHFNHYDFLLALSNKHERHRPGAPSLQRGWRRAGLLHQVEDSSGSAATCCRTSSTIPGTASTAARSACGRPTSTSPSATTGCGCTRASPSTRAR